MIGPWTVGAINAQAVSGQTAGGLWSATKAANNTGHVTGTVMGSGEESSTGQTTFAGLLGRALDQISAQEKQADRLTSLLAAGQPVDLHEVVIATEKAQLTLDLAVQIRNKVVEAYQEIMRMPV